MTTLPGAIVFVSYATAVLRNVIKNICWVSKGSFTHTLSHAHISCIFCSRYYEKAVAGRLCLVRKGGWNPHLVSLCPDYFSLLFMIFFFLISVTVVHVNQSSEGRAEQASILCVTRLCWVVKGEEDSSLGCPIFLLIMEHRSYLNVYHNF